MRGLLGGLLLVFAAGCAATGSQRTSPAISTAKDTKDTKELLELGVSLQRIADSIRVAQRWPGLSVAVVMADGRVVAAASGYSDTVRKTVLTTNDRLLQGSVGKTYVSAVAMQMVDEGLLDLDAPISRYLGHAPWFDSLPNGRDATVRQIMQHTSGLVRYEFQPSVTARLRVEPFKVWTPVERLRALFGTTAPFAAGKGWEYSDTNYIVLGMIIERLTGRSYYQEV
ncbi:MAG: serine hydrolase domain-containing protein, partial [Gemmatimonas sp.]